MYDAERSAAIVKVLIVNHKSDFQYFGYGKPLTAKVEEYHCYYVNSFSSVEEMYLFHSIGL